MYLRTLSTVSKEKCLMNISDQCCHTLWQCARHVSCSQLTWMNNGVNWNKVDNKSHCDHFNPQIYTCMHTSCSAPWLWLFPNMCSNYVCVADPLASLSHQTRRMQVGRERSLGNNSIHPSRKCVPYRCFKMILLNRKQKKRKICNSLVLNVNLIFCICRSTRILRI